MKQNKQTTKQTNKHTEKGKEPAPDRPDVEVAVGHPRGGKGEIEGLGHPLEVARADPSLPRVPALPPLEDPQHVGAKHEKPKENGPDARGHRGKVAPAVLDDPRGARHDNQARVVPRRREQHRRVPVGRDCNVPGRGVVRSVGHEPDQRVVVVEVRHELDGDARGLKHDAGDLREQAVELLDVRRGGNDRRKGRVLHGDRHPQDCRARPRPERPGLFRSR